MINKDRTFKAYLIMRAGTFSVFACKDKFDRSARWDSTFKDWTISIPAKLVPLNIPASRVRDEASAVTLLVPKGRTHVAKVTKFAPVGVITADVEDEAVVSEVGKTDSTPDNAPDSTPELGEQTALDIAVDTDTELTDINDSQDNAETPADETDGEITDETSIEAVEETTSPTDDTKSTKRKTKKKDEIDSTLGNPDDVDELS